MADSDAKAAAMELFGLKHCINARTTDFANAVKTINRHDVFACARSRRRQSFSSASERTLLPLFENGKLRAVIDRVFPLDAALEGQSYMVSNAHRGKLLPRP